MRNLVLTLLLFIGITKHFSQTNIPGGNLSGTLTLAGSPYLVQGHVLIPANSLLKINPGVVIEFQGHYKMNVQGRLLAQGNVTDSITFRVPQAQIANGWWGIRFEMTNPSQDSSLLEYCKIRYGKANGNGDDYCGGGIFIKNFSKVRVSHCYIASNNAFYGGGIFLHWASPVINHNTVIENNTLIGMGGVGGAGICCDSVAAPLIRNNLVQANNVQGSGFGGGIRCDKSSPTIQNNTITANYGDVTGAGISCLNYSFPLIKDNLITANYNGSGAGIYCDSGASPVITGNSITSNTATAESNFPAYGGGIYIKSADSKPVLSKNLISNNFAKSRGGGMEVFISTATVRDNTIHSNYSGEGGGVSLLGGVDLVFSKNVITNNHATTGGGLAMVSSVNQCILTNNLIANNSSYSNGGGIWAVGLSPVISNCNIVNNQSNTQPSYTAAAYGGGGLYFAGACTATLVNCIVYNNISGNNNGHQVYLDDNGSDPPIYNSDIEGGSAAFYTNGSVYTGTYSNNISVSPGFVASSGGAGNTFNGLVANWHLSGSSPCINVGKQDTTGLYLPATDLGGNNRIVGSIDLGVYETSSCAGFQVSNPVVQIGPSLSISSIGNFQWLNCNNGFNAIAGQTNALFTPTVNGSYAVQINSSGCTYTTACFAMNNVGLSESLFSTGISISPNPGLGEFVLSTQHVPPFLLEIRNELGQTVFSTKVRTTPYHFEIHQPGIYLVTLKNDQSTVCRKLIVEP